MNIRLSLPEFVGRLTGLLPAGTYVSHSKANDYLTKFGKTYPAVWVLAQKIKALSTSDEGDGTSGFYRQHMNCEVAVRCVVQRYAEGQISSESALNDLVTSVAGALVKWQPTGAALPLRIVAIADGSDSESVSYADVIVGTQLIYSDA